MLCIEILTQRPITKNMGLLQEKSSSLSLNCGNVVSGRSSLLRNKKKKKFDYNNGKCLHGIEAVVLKSGTEWNPDRLFLGCPLWESAEHRCEYFVWLDEVEGKTKKKVETEVESKERSLKQSYQKMNELTEYATKLEEDVQQLQKTVNLIRGEIKCIKNMVMGICLGLKFCVLWIFRIYAQK
ncbi:uncharacterized protein LOC110271667 [Arachis ipaensis]|uniref:Zinc finger GRF-type domain-containing protein n=1 Tax=Arachis hypogaea TaxID=3818 RepID=A0A6B9V2A8_ARAHY|nr:uncharacterized protein LOC110271667 [Arachis ipaensis]XP_025657243.1 uncharacterized protein LOC112752075 [Arachis hypogaea]QHN75419.1 uncharacterized protein DS421_19g635170 [Arachis hypogaea]QHN75420.1 uncharacterized protein DS421_19g635170 [Arachis hypogaea]